MRPVADHYDRTQDTPWDVIKQAAEEGLYGLDYIQAMGSDSGGLFGVIYAEEIHWGCAGIALAISASGLAAAGIASSGTGDQIARWVPECFGTADDPKLGAYAVTDRKSTRLNSSHANISYAVFCLKKKNKKTQKQS